MSIFISKLAKFTNEIKISPQNSQNSWARLKYLLEIRLFRFISSKNFNFAYKEINASKRYRWELVTKVNISMSHIIYIAKNVFFGDDSGFTSFGKHTNTTKAQKNPNVDHIMEWIMQREKVALPFYMVFNIIHICVLLKEVRVIVPFRENSNSKPDNSIQPQEKKTKPNSISSYRYWAFMSNIELNQ